MIVKRTVKELIGTLKKLPQDAIVFVASDSEQNEVSPFMDVSTGVIGQKVHMPAGEYGLKEDFDYVDGDFFRFIDLKLDFGKPYVILNPSL